MNSELPNIYVTKSDYERLSVLIDQVRNTAADELEEELSRATVLAEAELPFDVVTMGSTIEFRDLESGKKSVVALVYPEKANFDEGKISVLAPIGIALIGLRLGEVIEWPVPRGDSRRLQVTSISRE